jgi:hypothetical protein
VQSSCVPSPTARSANQISTRCIAWRRHSPGDPDQQRSFPKSGTLNRCRSFCWQHRSGGPTRDLVPTASTSPLARPGSSRCLLYPPVPGAPDGLRRRSNSSIGCAGQATSSGHERSRADSRRDRSVDPRNQAVADAVGVFPVSWEFLLQRAVFEGSSHHGYDDSRRRWNQGPHRVQCQCHGERGQNAS